MTRLTSLTSALCARRCGPRSSVARMETAIVNRRAVGTMARPAFVEGCSLLLDSANIRPPAGPNQRSFCYLQPRSSTGDIPMTSSSTAAPIMTSQQFLEHWQGHRVLTRRIIDAFPEEELFNYSVGGMRPFSALAMEFIGMAVPTVQGV